MVRFEINDKRIPIIGSLENLSIGAISFSNHLFALVRSLTVYKTYLIGTNSFETTSIERMDSLNKIDDFIRKPVKNLNDGIFSFFAPVSSKSDCLFSKFGITATDKDNSDIIIPTYECVNDELKEIYYKEKANMVGREYYYFEKESYPYPTVKTGPSCAANNVYNCSCNFINNNMKIFLGNVSNHYCKVLEFIDFAKAKEIRINNVKGGGTQFTLHFWVFALSYVDKVFEGISVDWENFVKIQVGLDSTGNYYFDCFIKDKPQKHYVDFKMGEWNFLHCSVDYPNKKYYIASENKGYEYGFTEEYPPTETQTDLVFNDLTNVRDWGILFYRHIRIWERFLRSNSFL